MHGKFMQYCLIKFLHLVFDKSFKFCSFRDTSWKYIEAQLFKNTTTRNKKIELVNFPLFFISHTYHAEYRHIKGTAKSGKQKWKYTVICTICFRTQKQIHLKLFAKNVNVRTLVFNREKT